MQDTSENTPSCKRCGACCRNGGPALHSEDLPIIENGTIQLSDIVTLRPGERAYDQVEEAIVPLETEILKIRGRDNTWTCRFFSPEGQSCGIYETRPLECELLFCGDTGPLAEVYDKSRLTRRNLLPEGHPLLELVAEHDVKCAPRDMEALAKRAREGDDEAGRALREMVRFDMELRRLVTEKTGGGADMTDFLFGRQLRTLLGVMNIKVYAVGDSIRFGFAQGD